jgi:hypothetical protein
MASSRVPYDWSEDQLLHRLSTGFMDKSYAPQGHIARLDPDGRNWELIAVGLRNAFDIAFNQAGELFTYDADMEWDIGDPWYRPTRVNHVISGAEFGFRNGDAKWPNYYLDSHGAVVNIGPGSPTGVLFGYGAKFPARYQQALFLADWSFGKIRALRHRLEAFHGRKDPAAVPTVWPGTIFPLVHHRRKLSRWQHLRQFIAPGKNRGCRHPERGGEDRTQACPGSARGAQIASGTPGWTQLRQELAIG